MSLHRRLVLGVLSLVTVVVVTLSITVYLALESFLVGRLDNQLLLTDRGSRADMFCKPSPRLLKVSGRLSVAWLTTDGRVLQTCRIGDDTGPLTLTPADVATLLASKGRPVVVDNGGTDLRAVASPLHPGGFGVLALPMTDVQDTLSRLLVLEIVLGGLAVATAALLGWGGVRLGLRPLTHITRTARAVADDVSADSGGLERRVPHGRPGSEVGQLASAFNQMLAEVQREVTARQDSEARMRQFLADASHELRTPLTSLRGYAELLRLRAERTGTPADPEPRDALRRMEAEGTRMSRLLEALLVLARADQEPTVAIEPVPLDELVADAVSDLRTGYPNRRIDLDTEPGAIVRGDHDQLQQVLANLLTNAAVHTDPTSPIQVTMHRRADRVELTVRDHGPGLNPDQAARAFDRFWQADPSRSCGGSGLGLSIVDALVTAHNGHIRFDTSPQTGTTVTVDLPSDPSAHHPGSCELPTVRRRAL